MCSLASSEANFQVCLLRFLQLELAMEGRTLHPGNQMWHYCQMKTMEEANLQSTRRMQSILLVEKDGGENIFES
jgi:hypothetical protein